jgi:hypothetical protein
MRAAWATKKKRPPNADETLQDNASEWTIEAPLLWAVFQSAVTRSSRPQAKCRE